MSIETKTKPQAFIYCRVSSAAQVAKGHGAESQRTRCAEFAARQGYEIAEVFKDEAVSGSMIDRPGIKAMLSKIRSLRKRHECIVIIDDISRLARDMKTHLELRDAISSVGARLESPSIEFGEDSDAILVEHLLASVSQHQRQKNAEQTRNRMRARLQNGFWTFMAPPGYRYQRLEGKGKVLVRDEPLASIIQNALEGYSSGHFGSQADVKRYLQSQPEFPKTRFGTVTNETANRILTRLVYAGYVESEDWGVSRRKGQHDGLVTLETFERVQTRLNETARAPVHTNIADAFPLRGHVNCSDCDGPLTSCWSKSKTGKRHPYYMCFTKDCDLYRKSIPRAEIEGQFEELLKSVRPAKSLFEMAKVMFEDAWSRQLTRLQEAHASSKTELVKVDKQIDGLLDRVVEATSPSVISAYEKRIAKLEREKNLLSERLAEEPGPLKPFRDVFELAMGFLANPSKIWDLGGYAEKQTVLKLTFSGGLQYSRKEGFRTPQVSVPFGLFQIFDKNAFMAERQSERCLTSWGYVLVFDGANSSGCSNLCSKMCSKKW